MGMQLVQSLRLKQYFTTRMSIQARLLPMNTEKLETELERQLRENPALVRRGGPPGRIQAWAKDRIGGAGAGDDRLPADQRLSVPDGFEEGLIAEARLLRMTDEEKLVASHIIMNLTGHGFLNEPLETLADKLDVSLETARSAQAKIMGLEPEGVGADNLTHYLIYVVDRAYGEDPFFHDIIRHHLDDLRTGRFQRVADAIDQDVEDVEEYRSMLTRMRPYPTFGMASGEDAIAVTAQMSLRKDDDEGWTIDMHEEPTHNLRLNEEFLQRIKAMPKGKDRDNAQKQLNAARELLQVLEERHSLLKQVTMLAVSHQSPWFESDDPQFKRNLTQVTVAEQLEKHPSVVSRVVQGKYLEWNGKLIKLRDLFHYRRCASGEDTSEAALHARIREIIDGENAARPLSDEAVSRRLKELGIRCARRTVAKHRDRLGIPPSNERKRKKA